MCREIERSGYKAFPVPASEITNEEENKSLISHKSVARCAGLGWIGKSLLLISDDHGPRVRLATVLTDMPLEAGTPMKNRCGDCKNCIESCIVNALKDNKFEKFPDKRENSLDVERCARKLEEFASNKKIGKMVCGICIKACPHSKK